MRAAKFALVGIMNTAVDFAVFNLLFVPLGVPLVPANVCGYAAGILNSYAWNRGWTFVDRSSSRRGPEFIKFVVTSVSGILVNTAAVWGLSKLYVMLTGVAMHAGTPNVLAVNAIKICAIAASMAWNYVVLSRWVFVARRSCDVE